jgi:hypothetical protein
MANLVFIGANKKSAKQESIDPRARHIQEWRESSDSARNKALGENAFKDAESLYNMSDAMTPGPVYRPSLSIPMLQRIMLEEANQVSNLSPKMYVFPSAGSSDPSYAAARQADPDDPATRPATPRDLAREVSLQAQWQISKMNLHLLMAGLTARYCGAGWIVAGFDPDLGRAHGGMWARSIDPRLVFFDPGTDYTWDPVFSGWGTWMNLEDIRLKWPVTSRAISPRHTSGGFQPFSGDSGYGIGQPSGPMSTMPGTPGQNSKTQTSEWRYFVNHCFCKDYTRETVEKDDVPATSLIDPEVRLKYPNGRWLIECEGVILQDGGNPYPRRRDINAPRFPLFPQYVLPPLFGPWGIPVTRMTENMQRLAQRFYSQIFENGLRMNNALWCIEENTGIDIDGFGGLPGEVMTIKPGSKPPTPITPNAIGSGALQGAEKLLSLQNDCLGFSASRQGDPGAGNVSTDLFDSAVLQSSGLLQLAGRFLSETAESIGTFFFDVMCKYQQPTTLPYQGVDDLTLASWAGIIDPSTYDLALDQASVRPLSEAVIRKLTPGLMEKGIIGPERGLRTLGYPAPAEIAQEQQTQQALQALAKVRSGKK